jgi:hypothetical protein
MVSEVSFKGFKHVLLQTEGLDSDSLGVFLSTYDYHKAGGGDDDANVSTASLLSEDAQGESTRYVAEQLVLFLMRFYHVLDRILCRKYTGYCKMGKRLLCVVS